jgi:hypothetical protein
MKSRAIAMTALGVILSAITAIVAVLNTPTGTDTPTDPAQNSFDQPSIGKDPPAYKPLFRPSKKPGCDGPNCPQ